MDEQRKIQARNCISQYCFYPRTSANELVDRMNQGEIEKILRVCDPVDKKPEDKQKEVHAILDACKDRWEGEAKEKAEAVMKEQSVLHAAQRAPAADAPATSPPAAAPVEPPAESSEEPVPPPEPPAAA